MISAVKLTTPKFPVPIGAGSLDFSEQYLFTLEKIVANHLNIKYLLGATRHFFYNLVILEIISTFLRKNLFFFLITFFYATKKKNLTPMQIFTLEKIVANHLNE